MDSSRLRQPVVAHLALAVVLGLGLGPVLSPTDGLVLSLKWKILITTHSDSNLNLNNFLINIDRHLNESYSWLDLVN